MHERDSTLTRLRRRIRGLLWLCSGELLNACHGAYGSTGHVDDGSLKDDRRHFMRIEVFEVEGCITRKCREARLVSRCGEQ